MLPPAWRFPPIPMPPPTAAHVPVGSVVAFMGDPGRLHLPLLAQGWMVCDGSELDVQRYRELFDVIGYQYSTTSGGGTFHLPDLRGYFLRGVDERQGAASNDPDSSSRQRADGATGPVVGSTQDCALQLHEHQYTPALTLPAGAGGHSGGKGTGLATTSALVPEDVPTSKFETRPKNVYVYFIIKYTRSVSALFPPVLLPRGG